MLSLFLFYYFLYLINYVYCKYERIESGCGLTYVPPKDGFIFNGQPLKPNEHPWFCHFDIGYNNETRHCSGTLISEEDIITSASCFDDSRLLHQKFKMLSCGSINNMVPLIPLDVKKHKVFGIHNLARIKIEKVAFSTIIRPVCITKNEKVLQGSSLTVVGSGKQKFDYSDEQRKAVITIQNVSKCEGYDTPSNELNTFICAGEFFVGIREGDEGAPLLAHYGNRHYLIGMVSSKREELPGPFLQNISPVLFTRISAYCNTFIRDSSSEVCLNNTVPIEATKKSYSCGAVSEKRMSKRAFGHGLDLLQPWYCKIYDSKNTTYECSGTLISMKHILTVAHCMIEKNKTELTFHCGIELQTYSKAANIIIYPKYIESTLENDIAVIELEEEIEFDGIVGAACLIDDDTIRSYHDDLIAVGSNNQIPMTSKSIKLKMLNSDNCDAELNMKTNPTTSLCLEGYEVSPQEGDSGGPLLVKINERWHVIGIISGGEKGTLQQPTYLHFTRVSGFYNFINYATNENVYWSESSCKKNYEFSLLLFSISVAIRYLNIFL